MLWIIIVDYFLSIGPTSFSDSVLSSAGAILEMISVFVLKFGVSTISLGSVPIASVHWAAKLGPVAGSG